MLKNKRITIIRDYQPEATKGRAICNGDEICKTLERPKSYNKESFRRNDPKTTINESCCIPEGVYDVIWSYSNRFKKYTYEITKIPGGWEGVRIHSANKVDELLGCIALCKSIQNMNPNNDKKIPSDKKWWASQSKDAITDFLKLMNQENFQLEITSNQSLCNA